MAPLVGMYGTPALVAPQSFTNYSPPTPEPMRWTPWRTGIAVTVQVSWESDGPEWLDGIARRWHGRHVYVEVDDRRLRTTGVWVDAGDVRR